MGSIRLLIAYALSLFALRSLALFSSLPDTQQRVCDIIGGQLLSSRPGSTLFGRQVGASTSGHLEFKGGWKKNGKEASETTHKMFRHNDESFSKMWKQDEYEVEAQIRRWHNELRNDGVAASTREWILFDVVRK